MVTYMYLNRDYPFRYCTHHPLNKTFNLFFFFDCCLIWHQKFWQLSLRNNYILSYRYWVSSSPIFFFQGSGCKVSSQQGCQLTWSHFTLIYHLIPCFSCSSHYYVWHGYCKRRKRLSPSLWDIHCTKVRALCFLHGRLDCSATHISPLNYL